MQPIGSPRATFHHGQGLCHAPLMGRRYVLQSTYAASPLLISYREESRYVLLGAADLLISIQTLRQLCNPHIVYIQSLHTSVELFLDQPPDAVEEPTAMTVIETKDIRERA